MTTEFLETPVFPDRISANLEVGPTWKTQVVALRSGFEQRNQEWSQARLVFNLATAITTDEEYEEVLAWTYVLAGQSVGFRIRHPKDYICTVDDGYLTSTGNGDGSPTGQLSKLYTIGALEYVRTISKPRSGTATVYYGGVEISPSIDYTTGVVTYSALDTASVVTASPASGGTTLVTLSDALSGLVAGDKVYLSGITGTIGNTLNSTAHTVNVVSGSPATVLDLEVDTDGLSYTSGGTASLYPQASTTLRWAGQFDVPVRFGTDSLRMLMKTVNFHRLNDVPIIEIRVA